jgi:hypothetical protein
VELVDVVGRVLGHVEKRPCFEPSKGFLELLGVV